MAFPHLQDLYQLECYIADSLNERKERKKIYTEGIFSPSSTAELGDKAGFVAARFVRYSKQVPSSQLTVSI
jgi:hypothetical protein